MEAAARPIDILVNNAGINMKKYAVEVTDADFDRIVQTNLHAVFASYAGMWQANDSAQARLDHYDHLDGSILRNRPCGRLHRLQIGGWRDGESARNRIFSTSVRINAVAPGFIETPMMLTAMNGDPSRRDKAMDRTPMGTWGKPDDIGWAAVFLASPAAKFITGVSLPVDGGNSIGF